MKLLGRDTGRVIQRMSPTELKKVEVLRARDGGFQRDLIPKLVNDIQAFLAAVPGNSDLLPSITLARVKGRKRLISVDGQNRTEAAIRARVALNAEIIDMPSVEAARNMFLLSQAPTHRRNLKWWQVVAASNHQSAEVLKKFAVDYGATWDHIRRLITGITANMSSRYYDCASSTRIPENILRITRTVLDEWTSDRRWKPSAINPEPDGRYQERRTARKIVRDTGSYYCVAGVLQAVGAVIYKLKLTSQDRNTIINVVRTMKTAVDWESASFRDKAGRNGYDTWCELHETLLTAVSASLARSIPTRRTARTEKVLCGV